MAKENENIDLAKKLLEQFEACRETLTMWRVDEYGNLQWVTDKYGRDRTYYVIEKNRLKRDYLLSHMISKMDANEFGQFVCAYFKACEMAGITELEVSLSGVFDRDFKFGDKVSPDVKANKVLSDAKAKDIAQGMADAIEDSISIDYIEKELLRLPFDKAYNVFGEMELLLISNAAWKERAPGIREKILEKKNEHAAPIINGNVYQNGAVHKDDSRNVNISGTSDLPKLK